MPTRSAIANRDLIASVDTLIDNGNLSLAEAVANVGISRSTYYRLRRRLTNESHTRGFQLEAPLPQNLAEETSEFHALLYGYLMKGKRPGRLDGLRWTKAALTKVLNGGDRRTYETTRKSVAHWWDGQHLPANINRLADVFFDKTEADLRNTFLEKYDSARDDRANKITRDFFIREIFHEDELSSVFKFDEHAYGMYNSTEFNNISFSQFKDWWAAYPQGYIVAFYGARNRPHKPIAVLGLFPVPEEWIRRFLSRRLDETRLSPRSIRRANRQFWYLSGLSRDKASVRHQGISRFLPSFLLGSLARWIRQNEQFFRKFEYVEICAEATTQIGEDLLNKFAFRLATGPKGSRDKARYHLKIESESLKRIVSSAELFQGCERLAAELRSIRI